MGKTWRHIIFIFFLVLILAPFSRTLARENQGVIFNEIAWAGSSVSTADEWIELYNNSDQVVNLKNWSVCNKVKDPGCENLMIIISSGQIAPGGYFLISNNSKDHLFTKDGNKVESILNLDPDVIDSTLSLSNEDFGISLLNDERETVDVAGSGAKPFCAGKIDDKYFSMIRNHLVLDGSSPLAWALASDTSGLDDYTYDIASPQNSGLPIIKELKLVNSHYALGDKVSFLLDYEVMDDHSDLEKIEIFLTNGLKITDQALLEYGQKSAVFDPVDFCPSLKVRFTDSTGLSVDSTLDFVCMPKIVNVGFSEILPHPRDTDFNGDFETNTDDEWFEITNYSQEGIDLKNWIVEAPGEPPYVIDEVYLKYGESKIFYKSQTGISLNDSGDSLVLKNPFGETVDSVLIPSSSSKYNVSYNKWGDTWQWSTKSTPGQINQIVTLPFGVGGAVTEVEKATFTVETASGPVRMSNNPSYSPNLGDKITSRGQLYLEDNTYFALNFKVTPKNIPKPDSSIPLAINEKENAGSLIMVKRSTKKIKFPSQKLKHLGLKQLNMDYKASKISPFMVYLFSLFTVISVIFIYEICCRE